MLSTVELNMIPNTAHVAKEIPEGSSPGDTTVSRRPPEDNVDFSINSPAPEDERIVRPRKRNKTSISAKNDVEKPAQKKFRGKRGILKELTEMPLDILFEIFGQLHPVGLLNLARTTKALRGILMSRSALTIWQRARFTLPGLPDCPKDLSEPQYADLLFNSYCQACPAPKSQVIIWGLLTRLCSTCIDEKFLSSSVSNFRYSQLPSHIADMAPCASVNHFQGKKRFDIVYHDETQRRWLQEYLELPNKDAISAWCSEVKFNHKRVEALANQYECWSNQQAKDRAQELERIQLQRRNDIFKNLRELGWSDELEVPDIISQLESHSLVKQKKALTERIWVNIKPTLLRLLEQTKADLSLKRETEALKRAYLNIERLRKHLVSFNSLIAIPPILDILFSAPFHSVRLANSELFSELYTEAINQLPQICRDWREEKDRELVEMIQTVLPDVEADGTHLFLATTFFKSKHWLTRVPLPYPHVLANPYATAKCTENQEVEEKYSSFLEAGWNSYKHITFDKEAFEHAIAVVQACQFDPKTTTAKVMDAADPILECPLCAGYGGRCYMTWRRAVYHSSREHKSTKVPWILPEEVLAEEIRRHIDEVNIANKPESATYRLQFLCAHCRGKGKMYYLTDLQQHLISEHNKTTCSSEDIVKALDRDYTPPLIYYKDIKWAGRIR